MKLRDHLRMAACPEPGGNWSFHLLNRSSKRIDSVVVESVAWEWGDSGTSEEPGTRSGPIQPGGSAEVWRGDDSEMRLDLHVRVKHSAGTEKKIFSFGMLYKRRNRLDVLPGFARRGVLDRRD